METFKWLVKRVIFGKINTDMPIDITSSYNNDISKGKNVEYKPKLDDSKRVPTFKCIKGKWEACDPATEEVNSMDWEFLSFYTQNIWFEATNMEERYETLVQMINESCADFICLQEVIGPFFKALTENAEIKKKYYISGNPIRGYGVLILSKLPAYFYEHKYEESLMGRSLLVAEVWVNGDTFLVSTSHLESMRNAEIRKIQMKQVEEMISGYDWVFMGDLNFEFEWEEEKDSLNRELFLDLWESLIFPSEEKYTMPKSVNHKECTFDHIRKLFKTSFVLLKRGLWLSLAPIRIWCHSLDCAVVSNAGVVLSKFSKFEPSYIKRVGNFSCRSHKGEDPKDIAKDNIVRTPSDHLGLYGMIKIKEAEGE